MLDRPTCLDIIGGTSTANGNSRSRVGAKPDSQRNAARGARLEIELAGVLLHLAQWNHDWTATRSSQSTWE
jgi:hypothetical protein